MARDKVVVREGQITGPKFSGQGAVRVCVYGYVYENGGGAHRDLNQGATTLHLHFRNTTLYQEENTGVREIE